MGRYELPGPKCRHKPSQRVFAGDPEGVYASTYCCGRDECIADASAWVTANTHLPAKRKDLPGVR